MFIIVLIALLIAMIVGFGVYIANSTKSAKSAKNSNSDNPFNITIPKDNGSDSDSGSSPNGGINIDDFFSNNGNSGSYTEIEDEITLVEDNGETQNRDTDNKDSVGKPDEKAAALVLNPLPADKDNAKYNTNSAYAAVSDSVVTVECFLDRQRPRHQVLRFGYDLLRRRLHRHKFPRHRRQQDLPCPRRPQQRREISREDRRL